MVAALRRASTAANDPIRNPQLRNSSPSAENQGVVMNFNTSRLATVLAAELAR
jgi:hypothetical protein